MPCKLTLVQDLTKDLKCFDGLCVIDDSCAQLRPIFENAKKYDKAFDSEVSCIKSDAFDPVVIYAPLADLDEYDDVRRYAEAGKRAMERAIKAGCKAPVLVLPSTPKYKFGDIVTLLGALEAFYVPIQFREDVPSKKQRFTTLGVHLGSNKLASIVQSASIYEKGLNVARDIGGGDPERMAPPKVAAYVKSAFLSVIEQQVIKDSLVFTKDFPLFQAVNRAAQSVPRHGGHIIFLEYKPKKVARKTVMLVGKGVTYDTGGADIKAGGHMAGMSRDKCGAAAVAGFMKLVELLQPEDVHVIAALCMVRNSVGEECYVADEIITSRAGVRVRIGNTDAEGRMAMADSLCLMKERVLSENLPDPHLYTVATLTGHACLAVGPYTIVIDNGPADAVGHAQKFREAGEELGHPCEISILRKQDFAFNAGKAYGEDIVQCNNEPSSRTPRGHQVPAAFLIVTSGLDQYGARSKNPIKYSHLDIAGSSGDVPDTPTGAPILALANLHLR